MLPARFIGRGGALLPQPKSGHGQEPEAETIAQLVAATLARLYGKPDWPFLICVIHSVAMSLNDLVLRARRRFPIRGCVEREEL